MTMRKFALFALLMVGLAGCASTSSPYGNFIQNTGAANDKTMAEDVVKKLVALYPPASTRFNLQHATPDAFGASLVDSMRAKGYALLEFQPEPTADAAAPAPTTPVPTGMSLSYILDQAGDADLYRVTLLIQHQSLSRVYQIKDGMVYPAGYWIRKE
jgi:hypothetical protein